MTALKPIENRRVRGTASETYPSNRVCAHPDCNEPVTLRPNGEPTVHHIFPRSQINSASYFVEIENEDGTVIVTPHAVGLCGSGTTGHHGDVEEHQAWIKLEDGVFNWYTRVLAGHEGAGWVLDGPLNPQPGSTEGKPKKRRKPAQPARNKTRLLIHVPKDAQENGTEVLETLIDGVREKLRPEFTWSETVPPYYVLCAALAQVLQS